MDIGHRTVTIKGKEVPILNTVQVIGERIEEIKVPNNIVYLAHLNNNEHLVIIPDDVTNIYLRPDKRNCVMVDDIQQTYISRAIRELHGKIKFIGGSGISDFRGLAAWTEADVLDFSSLDTSNAKVLAHLAYKCKASSIILDRLDTSKVSTMYSMFYCDGPKRIDKLNFSSFNTPKLREIMYMFGNVCTDVLDISNIRLRKVSESGMTIPLHVAYALLDIQVKKLVINKDLYDELVYEPCNAKGLKSVSELVIV